MTTDTDLIHTPAAPADAGLDWLDELRRGGAKSFRDQGLPTPRVEEWKYTNLRSLRPERFARPETAQPAAPALPAPLVARPAARLAVVNGRVRPDLSDLARLPEGVTLCGLAEILARAPERVESTLGRIADTRRRPLLALNTAHIEDGVYLHLAEGVALDAPIELVFLGDARDTALVCHPRNLLLFDPNSAASVIEHHISTGAVWTNPATEIEVGDGARVGHYRLQDEGAETYHLANLTVAVGQGADYDNFVFSTGARLARNEMHCKLVREQATAHLNGGYLISGRQHCDNTSVIEHIQPHGNSNQTYSGVIDERARAVFQGRINVWPGAQKTDGYQLNQALLLSERAEIDSKPELEIFADDVACSHGATAGQLDAEALFYLRARGLDEASARALLIRAFIGGALDQIQDPRVRAAFEAHALRWLGQAPDAELDPDRGAEEAA